MCASGDNHMKDCNFQGERYSHYLVCDILVAFTNKPPYRWHERDRTNTNGPDRGDQMTTAYLNKGCPRNHLMTALCASGEDSDQCQQWGSPFHGSMAFQCHEVDTSQYEIKYVGEGGDPSEADKHFFHELIEQPGNEHRGTDPAPNEYTFIGPYPDNGRLDNAYALSPLLHMAAEGNPVKLDGVNTACDLIDFENDACGSDSAIIYACTSADKRNGQCPCKSNLNGACTVAASFRTLHSLRTLTRLPRVLGLRPEDLSHCRRSLAVAGEYRVAQSGAACVKVVKKQKPMIVNVKEIRGEWVSQHIQAQEVALTYSFDWSNEVTHEEQKSLENSLEFGAEYSIGTEMGIDAEVKVGINSQYTFKSSWRTSIQNAVADATKKAKGGKVEQECKIKPEGRNVFRFVQNVYGDNQNKKLGTLQSCQFSISPKLHNSNKYPTCGPPMNCCDPLKDGCQTCHRNPYNATAEPGLYADFKLQHPLWKQWEEEFGGEDKIPPNMDMCESENRACRWHGKKHSKLFPRSEKEVEPPPKEVFCFDAYSAYTVGADSTTALHDNNFISRTTGEKVAFLTKQQMLNCEDVADDLGLSGNGKGEWKGMKGDSCDVWVTKYPSQKWCIPGVSPDC